MPIPQVTRINPLDLQKVAIGIAVPFDDPSVFKFNYSTKDQIKSNLINLLLTNKGERVMNPEYGTGILNSLFDPLNESTYNNIREKISMSVGTFMSKEISVKNIEFSPNEDGNTLYLTISYTINLSGQQDEITIQLI